jgi:hypothetical protein
MKCGKLKQREAEGGKIFEWIEAEEKLLFFARLSFLPCI